MWKKFVSFSRCERALLSKISQNILNQQDRISPFGKGGLKERLLNALAGFDQFNNRLLPQVDHGHFIRALTSDEGALVITAESDVCRSGADSKTCSCFVLLRVNQANARFSRIRNDNPFPVRGQPNEMRINTDGNRRDHAMRRAVPHGQIVGSKIGDVTETPVGAEGGEMGAFPCRNRGHRFVTARAHDRHIIRLYSPRKRSGSPDRTQCVPALSLS